MRVRSGLTWRTRYIYRRAVTHGPENATRLARVRARRHTEEIQLLPTCPPHLHLSRRARTRMPNTRLPRALASCVAPCTRSQFGFTALIYAAMHGHAETAKALLEHGASLQARSASGKTALDYARDESQSDVIQLLQDARRVPTEPARAACGRMRRRTLQAAIPHLSLTRTLMYRPTPPSSPVRIQAQERLLDAAERGSDDDVHSLLAARVNPNAADPSVSHHSSNHVPTPPRAACTRPRERSLADMTTLNAHASDISFVLWLLTCNPACPHRVERRPWCGLAARGVSPSCGRSWMRVPTCVPGIAWDGRH